MSNNKMIVYHNGVPILVERLDEGQQQQMVPQPQYYPPPQQYQQPPMHYTAPCRNEAEWCRQPDANGASGVAWKAILIFILGWVPGMALEAYGCSWLVWSLGGTWLAFRAGRRG